MKRKGNLFRCFFSLFESLRDFHPLASNMGQIVKSKSLAKKARSVNIETHRPSSCLRSAFSNLVAVDLHTPKLHHCSRSVTSVSIIVCSNTSSSG